MTSAIATIRDRATVLPKKLGKGWEQAKVYIFSTGDTLIWKKAEKSISKLSDIAARITAHKMSQKKIEAEIQAYRQQK